jgi:hypothetical protein
MGSLGWCFAKSGLTLVVEISVSPVAQGLRLVTAVAGYFSVCSGEVTVSVGRAGSSGVWDCVGLSGGKKVKKLVRGSRVVGW